MQQNYVNGNRISWLLGDSGYPIEPWLMTPCPNAEDGSPQANYNRSHVSGRNCVERCIGAWKGWFRCLRRERTMHYTPQCAGIIVNACAVLHNMALHYNVVLPQLHLEEPLNIPLPMYEGVYAVNARNRLVAQHFV